MKKLIFLFSILLSSALFGATADEVFEKYLDNINRDSRMLVEMKFMTPGGETDGVRVFEEWKMKDGSGMMKLMIDSKKPAAVKGERLLVVQNKDRENDVWEYIPEQKKVRRLLATEYANPYLGSPEGTLTNEDRALMKKNEYTSTLIKEEELNGEQCYVLEVKKKGSDTQYSKIEMWVVKDKWVALKKVYYSGSKAVKEELVKDLVEVKNGWFYSLGLMKNLETDKKVMYRVPKALFEDEAKVTDSIFTQRYLETGRAN